MTRSRAEQAVDARDAFAKPWLASCDDAIGLEAIGRREVQLAIWRRSLPSHLTQWLNALKRAELPDLSVVLSTSASPALVASFMVSTPGGPMRDLLAEDACALVRSYAALTGCAFVTVRLESVSDDSCSRFHRDASKVRLFTTYRGKGTEFVAPENSSAAIREQRSYRGAIERLAAHEVAVWKGTGAEEGDALVHRSPPMQRADSVRLVLCVDAPVDERGWIL